MSSMTDLWLSGVFFQALNTPKLVFGPDPLGGGAYDAPPDPVVPTDTPSHILPPRRLQRLDLGAFRTSVVRPPNTNSWLRL